MAARRSRQGNSGQKPKKIGFLGATKRAAWAEFITPFERRLRELGWIDGHNVEIDYHWADGRQDRYGKIAKDLARDGVDVIVTSGTPAVLAAKNATKSIPIVFAAAGDPVRTGLVASLQRPGGNVTGLSNGQTELAGKRLDVLREAVPGLHTLGVLGNRASANVRLEMDELEKRARTLGIETIVCDVHNESQIAPALKKLKGKADALYVCTDPFIVHHRISVNTLAAGLGLPTMHAFRDHIEDGGLISYGPNFRDMFGRAAELVVNMAEALGLKIPAALRRRADAAK